MTDRADNAAATRQHWLSTIERHRHDRDAPGSADYWSPRLDTASRDELRAIQDDKIAAVTPFLYENSEFYRRRFDRLGLVPSDLRTVDDLIAKWPVVDKLEMAEDAAREPPYGTYTAMNEAIWADRGWMMFSSSGTTGAPRVFRYSHLDRELWAWANARALHSMDFRNGDTVFMITGYGPHVWAWGVQYALAKMALPTLPGGGMDARAPMSLSATNRRFCSARRPMRCISGARWRRSASIRARLRCARCSSPASPA
jgi:phenylacetate-CoA ligase